MNICGNHHRHNDQTTDVQKLKEKNEILKNQKTSHQHEKRDEKERERQKCEYIRSERKEKLFNSK